MSLIPKKRFLLFALGLAVLSSGCLSPSSDRRPTGCPASDKASAPNTGLDIASLRSEQPSAAVNAFWDVDSQYLNAPTLAPHSRVMIAELQGPDGLTLLRIPHIPQLPQLAKAGLQRGINEKTWPRELNC